MPFNVNGTVVIDDNRNVIIPAGTDAQRPGSPSDGMIRVNTSAGGVEFYSSSTSWVSADDYAKTIALLGL